MLLGDRAIEIISENLPHLSYLGSGFISWLETITSDLLHMFKNALYLQLQRELKAINWTGFIGTTRWHH